MPDRWGGRGPVDNSRPGMHAHSLQSELQVWIMRNMQAAMLQQVCRGLTLLLLASLIASPARMGGTAMTLLTSSSSYVCLFQHTIAALPCNAMHIHLHDQ